MAAYGGTGSASGSSYGDLSKNDAFTIQKKMLPIAKRLLTFAKFAQKETKPQKSGLEIRHRRYERFPVVDTPMAEGVTPDFVSLEHTTLKHTLKQYGSYVNTTDVMLAASTDPVLKVISERQAQQAGETVDFLSYKAFRAGTQVKYVGTSASARTDIDMHIGGAVTAANSPGANATLGPIQTAIRTLENNDAGKLKSKLKASVGIATEPIRESFIAICHPDLRQDIQALPGFVAVEKYSDQGDAIEGEIGGVEGVRFITTTQATPFKGAGDTSGHANCVSTDSVIDVYPVLIL
jgi:N4-gp56 family major capsid protein